MFTDEDNVLSKMREHYFTHAFMSPEEGIAESCKWTDNYFGLPPGETARMLVTRAAERKQQVW